MRRVTTALALALLLAAAGAAGAQTAEVQRKVETRLAVERLERGVLIADSLKVLARAPLDGYVLCVRKVGTYLRRLTPAQGPGDDE
jgi:hypothetical protein